ncbi:SAV_915 family protein [Micromonospora avicenniae]|uniref:SAV_915 family protein n=1 Tax=Micromonospora avicenniae TaxID=1198245 RepID=UPI0034463EDA
MDELPDTYVVPVRTTPVRQALTVRTGRLPQGQRVGLAFTEPERLARAMGADQPWIRLCESALRSMLTPLGIDRIQVDPLLVAPPVRPEAPAATPADASAPQQPVAAMAGTREA